MITKRIISFLVIFSAMALPLSAGAWYDGVVPGIDVYATDSAASNWDSAETACAALDDRGRVPTLIELELMYDNKASLGTFTEIDNSYYWSANESGVGNVDAYELDFFDKHTDSIVKSTTNEVRCVRTTQVYATADVTAVGTEVSSMYDGFIAPVILIFGLIFSMYLLRRLVRQWLGK